MSFTGFHTTFGHGQVHLLHTHTHTHPVSILQTSSVPGEEPLTLIDGSVKLPGKGLVWACSSLGLVHGPGQCGWWFSVPAAQLPTAFTAMPAPAQS